MGKWSKSLPEPMGDEPWVSDRAASALCSIADAMAYADGDRDWALTCMLQAAAEVRAWRKSLPAGAKRDRLLHPVNVRSGLRSAARNVLAAEAASTDGWRAVQLRHAEAYLREVARLLDKE